VPVSRVQGAQIRGVVSDAAGKALPPSQVLLALRHEDGTRVLTGTATDGSFTARSLGVGRWQVSASAPGHLSQSAHVDLSTTTSIANVNLALPAERALVVRLVDFDGRPLASALEARGLTALHAPDLMVSQGSAPEQRVPGSQLCDDDGGAVTVDGSELVRLRVALESLTLAEARIQWGESTVVIPVDAEQVDRAQARIELTLMQPLTVGSTLRVSRRGTGLLRRELPASAEPVELVLPPGSAVLHVSAAGCARVVRNLELTAGQRLRLGTLVMEKGHALRGWARDAHDRPLVTQVVVLARGSDGNWVDAVGDGPIQTDVHGLFSIGELAEGHYALACLPDGALQEIDLPITEDVILRGEPRAAIGRSAASRPHR